MSSRDLFETEFSLNRLVEIYEQKVARTSSAGKDGNDPKKFEKNLSSETQIIATRARNDNYKFTTYKQKLITKGPKKYPRQISIATVRDRITLRAITNILMEIFEDTRLPPAQHIISEVADYIRPLNDDYSFIQIDIKDYYPSILHDELERSLETRIDYTPLLNLIMKAVKTSTSDAKTDTPNSVGIPQGLSISNILSSIYMMKLDNAARSKFTYFRYVDDILVICKTVDAIKNFTWIKNELKKTGLECHDLTENSKTKIVLLSQGVEYLGYRLRPDDLSVRQSSYRKMIGNLMAVMTAARYSTNHRRIITRLNIKISGCIFNDKRMGWMFFFSMSDDLTQLKRLDAFVAQTWKNLGMERYGYPKRFVKTYHEIKYNLAATRYIPRFDEYTQQQKIELISEMQDLNPITVSSWSSERINKVFIRLIKKEVSELEKDVTPVS